MLKRLIQFSLDNPALILAAAALLIVAAGLYVPRMTVDVFPELNAPTVVVMAEAGGYAADEVEQYVTFPVESAMTGIPGVRRVRSSSAISLSMVWVEFDWGEDIYRARQLVAERLATAAERLPKGIHVEVAPISSLTGEIMLISLALDESAKASSAPGSEGKPDGPAPGTALASELELRAFAEYELSNRLLAVPGVAQVSAIGARLPEYQINIDPERLRLYGLTAQDVADAARAAHSVASAGYLYNVEGLEVPLRQSGRVRSVRDIEDTVVAYRKGAAITIGQVADVGVGGAPRRGAGSEKGNPAVILTVLKAPGTNTLALTDEIDRVLQAAQSALPPGVRMNTHAMRQADFINLSLDNVLHVLRDAAIFVAIVLLLFLFNVRATVITLTALPLSIAASLLLLWAWGLTINVMTLGGLAVAIGELVDDAIIDVENVFRRLRENRVLPPEQRRAIPRVVFEASNEIRSSVVFATVIIVLVFVPLLFLEGLEGRFFRPLGLAYITSLLASLIVALTVTPVLCRYLLGWHKGGKPGAGERESTVVRWLKGIYRPALELALRLRWPMVLGALAATGASLWFASGFGTSFLPEFNEGTFTVFLNAPPGTSLDESDRLARGVERGLADIEGVRGVTRRTGRAERDQHAHDPSVSEIEITVEEGREKQEIRKRIDEVIAALPGISATIGQPIEHRLSHVLSGTPAAVAINVFGDDLEKLRAIAKEIEGELQSVPGARDVAANREMLITSMPIAYRPADLKRWNLTRADASAQVALAFYGEKVAEINQGVRRYDLVVRLKPSLRQNMRDVEDFVLRGAGGAHVKLSEIADVGLERTSNLISRESNRRKAIVSCNVAEGANLGDLVEQVRAKVDPIVARAGYSVSYGGQFEAQQAASHTIYLMGAFVAVVIVMLLTWAFKSLPTALLVMINLPLALIGGIVAIYVTATPDLIGNTAALFGLGGKPYIAPVISIASMVGFVTLFGIAIRNGILLVTHYQHLMREDGLGVHDAIMQGSGERLAPILMTALTAVLGMLPIAMAAGEPGSELLAPLAVVVLGGLVTSTFLNLVVVPAGFSLIFERRARSVRPLAGRSSPEDVSRSSQTGQSDSTPPSNDFDTGSEPVEPSPTDTVSEEPLKGDEV